MQAVTTIIFLWEAAFTDRDHRRMGIDTLTRYGYRTEIWNLSPVLHRTPGVVYQPEGTGPGQRVRSFQTRREVEEAVAGLDGSCLVNCFIGFTASTWFIYRALSRTGVHYAVPSFNALPELRHGKAPDAGRVLARILHNLSGLQVRKYREVFLTSLLRRYHRLAGISPASLLLAGGVNPVRYTVYPVGPRTRTVWLHTMDYDIYRTLRDQTFTPEPGMGVFIDGYDFHHPDIARSGEAPYPWVDEYYRRLRALFEFLEETRGMRIVVAAHPLSDYPEPERIFGRRPVIRGRTPELIQKSRFTVMHASTAVNFAVLFRKPILFLTDENYRHHILGPMIETMAERLDQPLLRLDRPDTFPLADTLAIDPLRYRCYQHEYLKKEGSEDLPFWEIYVRAIREPAG
jgi:hypothetical protein